MMDTNLNIATRCVLIASAFMTTQAFAQTTANAVSGPGVIATFNSVPAGAPATPWTLTESMTAISPFTIRLFNDATNPVGRTNTAGGGFTFGKWFSVTMTNNTGLAWTSFDFELQSVLGTPSTDGDGLSFGQGAGFTYTSDRFSNVSRTEDVRDFLNFNGGSVLAGQSVTFNFAITDNTARNQFWLVQTPNRVVGGVPEPTTWAMMLFGFGAIGAVVRRSRVSKVSFA